MLWLLVASTQRSNPTWSSGLTAEELKSEPKWMSGWCPRFSWTLELRMLSRDRLLHLYPLGIVTHGQEDDLPVVIVVPFSKNEEDGKWSLTSHLKTCRAQRPCWNNFDPPNWSPKLLCSDSRSLSSCSGPRQKWSLSSRPVPSQYHLSTLLQIGVNDLKERYGQLWI